MSVAGLEDEPKPSTLELLRGMNPRLKVASVLFGGLVLALLAYTVMLAIQGPEHPGSGAPPSGGAEHPSVWPRLAVGVLLLGVALWQLANALPAHRAHVEHRARSRKVTATIAELRPGWLIKDRVEIVYTYRASDGTEHTVASPNACEGKSRTDALRVGAPVDIWYDPEDPSWVHEVEITDRQAAHKRFSDVVVFGLFAAVALGLAIIDH